MTSPPSTRPASQSAASRGDRKYLLESLVDICSEGERAFADCKQALTLMSDLEQVFAPRDR